LADYWPPEVLARLEEFARRPEPFSHYTAPLLWDDPHVSRQMLAAHLDPDSDRASYRPARIQAILAWLGERIALAGKRICDLGCGPGLYATALHDLGARVVGLDVSAHSLAHARHAARDSGRQIEYLRRDYIREPLPEQQDLFLMISQDFGALADHQRRDLLGRVRDALNPGGFLALDVPALAALASVREEVRIESRLMQGFWADGDYVGLMKSFVYPDARVSLDRYLILRAGGELEIFNWLQYFDPETLEAELTGAGFRIVVLTGGLDGVPLTADAAALGVVAVRV
jgi:SAM-dependent methyltransferase